MRGMWTEATISDPSGTVLAINGIHGGFIAFRNGPHAIDNNGALAACVTLMFLLVGYFLILEVTVRFSSSAFQARRPYDQRCSPLGLSDLYRYELKKAFSSKTMKRDSKDV